MPEYCSCGTTLVENARFCHRCGKPTFEMEDVVEVDAPPLPMAQAIPDAASAATPRPISFRNPIAMRVAFLMCVGIMLVQVIPGAQLLFVLWFVAGGWAGVLVYRRLTGVTLLVPSGARLGALTGVMTFLSLTLILASYMSVSSKEFLDMLVKQNPQLAPALKEPMDLVLAGLVSLCILFAMVVGTCAAGGALGARFAGRTRASSSPTV